MLVRQMEGGIKQLEFHIRIRRRPWNLHLCQSSIRITVNKKIQRTWPILIHSSDSLIFVADLS